MHIKVITSSILLCCIAFPGFADDTNVVITPEVAATAPGPYDEPNYYYYGPGGVMYIGGDGGYYHDNNYNDNNYHGRYNETSHNWDARDYQHAGGGYRR